MGHLLLHASNAVENLVLLGSGDINGTGNAANNVMWGNAARTTSKAATDTTRFMAAAETMK